MYLTMKRCFSTIKLVLSCRCLAIYIQAYKRVTNSCTRRPVTRYLVRVHKWSGGTKYDDINGPGGTIYVVISGPPKT